MTHCWKCGTLMERTTVAQLRFAVKHMGDLDLVKVLGKYRLGAQAIYCPVIEVGINHGLVFGVDSAAFVR